MQSLNPGVDRVNTTINNDLTSHEVTNGGQALLPVEHKLLSGLRINNHVYGRHLPFAENRVDQPLPLAVTPDFTALKLWTKVQVATIDSTVKSLNVRIGWLYVHSVSEWR